MTEVSDYWKPALEATERQRDVARGQVIQLRTALRRHGVVQRHRMAEGGGTVHVGWRCNVCDAEWDLLKPELHFPECVLFEAPQVVAASIDAETLTTARKLVGEKASTSFLQRKMGLTYNRAAAIMEQLERDGVVSKPNAAGMRKLVAVG